MLNLLETLQMTIKSLLNNSQSNLLLSYQSFFLSTFAVFKECKKPKREPDYISKDKKGNISSRYWYGNNRLGDYVIRESNHWSSYINNNTNTATNGCGTIGRTNCFWILRLSFIKLNKDKLYTAKAYFKDFKELN